MKIFLVFILLNLSFVMVHSGNQESVATFGGGCFWCIEAVFDELQGVTKVESGYSGGKISNPTYREVCSGLTGHAEVVKVYFDSEVISYKELLAVFFSIHDPTTLNRQGADVGPQYRSVIFYHDEAQKKESEEFIEELEEEGVFSNPVVTEVSPAEAFFVAEDYHQDYYENNPSQPYCQVVINPKMKKFKEKFSDKLKD
ncbi:peptide-methionine (S)-S-oxide reductase MsrA [Marinilabilia rubra]|uniref:Peptide methionine sulfoxide reductase MsrA n=1 Tax=Marinilabilia rubra TaxID=2162893 RepID=A0A2U2BC74_9BACT|nr:peptide-methionine (S)-S-oxide reductase MsrA [Marinilabilia rubra]PWE00668.1 peptide-methionine (S)-S-oxide reductase [Marinilabilia rubra]